MPWIRNTRANRMNSIVVEALLILLLLVLNGAFAMSEIAIVSSRKARLQQKAVEGSGAARRALELADQPNRFLATVQVGITLIGILAGAFGGATLARHLADWLEGFDAIAPYANALALAIVVGLITYMSLVIGELVPKRIGLTAPERIAMLVAQPMFFLSRLASPLVRVLSLSTDGVLRLLRVRPSDEPPVTEEEIAVMLEQGTRAGVFEEEERKLVERVFDLDARRVDAIMTPRPDITWLDPRDSPEVVCAKVTRDRHGRYPVCDGTLDAFIGIVDAKDAWPLALAGQPVDLRQLATQPLFVPGALTASRLLGLFRESGVHVAVVVDEYGSVAGLVTLNDVMEEITGQLRPDTQPRIVQRTDGSWLVEGSVSIEELAAALGVDADARWPTRDFRTVAGLVVGRLRRIPHEADSIREGDLTLEVIDMDGRRVDKVLVSRTAEVNPA
jgi:putative hemolysin